MFDLIRALRKVNTPTGKLVLWYTNLLILLVVVLLVYIAYNYRENIRNFAVLVWGMIIQFVTWIKETVMSIFTKE